VVSLVPSESRAVNARLLTRSDSDHLAITRVAYTVALRVLQCDARYDQVPDSRVGQLGEREERMEGKIEVKYLGIMVSMG
jgi:hypothetical protein